MMKKVARGAVQRENTRLVEVYMENLTKTFNGGDGRVRSW